jgi:hypothetical protein
MHPATIGRGNDEASRRCWVGEEVGEALCELREEAAWSAWVEEKCSSGSTARAIRSRDIFFLREANKA